MIVCYDLLCYKLIVCFSCKREKPIYLGGQKHADPVITLIFERQLNKRNAEMMQYYSKSNGYRYHHASFVMYVRLAVSNESTSKWQS